MDALEELSKILDYKTLIEEKTEDLIHLDSLAKKMTAALNGEAVSRSKNLDPLGTVVASKEAVAIEIARLQNELDKQKAFLSGIIDGLKKPVFIKILYGLYFHGKELKAVADKIGYSYRHTQDLRDLAVQAVQKIMDKSESSHNIS
jgi:hypothetical protein